MYQVILKAVREALSPDKPITTVFALEMTQGIALRVLEAIEAEYNCEGKE
jgi:hypothetical protein